VLAKGDTVTMSLSKSEIEDMIGRPLSVLLEQEVARREAQKARRTITMAWDELDIGVSSPNFTTRASASRAATKACVKACRHVPSR
jgi:hypothetical protein